MTTATKSAKEKSPKSRQPGWDEKKYRDYFDKECIWWPWWVAVEFYWRKTRQIVYPTTLMALANKYARNNGKPTLTTFKSGKNANSPTRLSPVDRCSFVNWVQGNSDSSGDSDEDE